MTMRVIEQPPSCLREYERVPSAFEVRERVDVEHGGSLRTQSVTPAYVKDYDAIAGNRPSEWARRWDLSRWRFVAAYLDQERVGGAAVVIDAREMDEADAAVLWDIRVRADFRRQGIGRQLLAFAEQQACASGRRRMRVETQDVNVAACRFYARAGYVLRAVNRGAYADLPDEVQLIWEQVLIACPVVPPGGDPQAR